MKHYMLYLALGLATIFASCTGKKEKEVAMATLNSTANNQSIGLAKFYQLENGEIKMDLEITMPERADSTVAVHFHEHGDCGNLGENTHGHWNPTNEPHGKWDSDAYHSGDIRNIELDNKGYAKMSVSTLRWTAGDGDVKDIIGRGIIIHGGTDDYQTQPTGNSGPRIGCGVITAVQ
ncbi:superoxide dismutase family protein [Pedobacter sp.]